VDTDVERFERVARLASDPATPPGDRLRPTKRSPTVSRAASIATQRVNFCRTTDGVRLAYALSASGPPLVKASNWLMHLDHDRDSPLWSHWWHGRSTSCSAGRRRPATPTSCGGPCVLDCAEAARQLDVLTLILHSTDDQVWAFDEAEELHSMVTGSRLVALPAGTTSSRPASPPSRPSSTRSSASLPADRAGRASLDLPPTTGRREGGRKGRA
jgi:hypothetical protein